MNCSIYCLVSRLEQVQPLMARLKDAGVPNQHVTMVFRSGDYWLLQRADEMHEHGASMWDAPFVSMALWWELAAVGLSSTQGAAAAEAAEAAAEGDALPAEQVVVPAGVFTSRLRGKRGN